jgi:hypothetical protein
LATQIRECWFVLRFLVDLSGAYRIAHLTTPYNSDYYRGHLPFGLQVSETRWTGDYVEITFRTRAEDDFYREGETTTAMPFCDLPDGEWLELIPLKNGGE